MSAEARRALAARIEAHPDALRGAGTGGPVHRAGAHAPRPRGAPRRAARVRRLGRHVVRRAARRADARGHRPAVARRLDAARRRQQGHLGDWRRRRHRPTTLEPSPPGRLHQRPPSCRAAWPTTCSGSAATRSGSRPTRGCSACCCRRCRAKRTRAGTRRSTPSLHFLRGLDLLPPESRHATVARQWWSLQRLVADMVFDTRARRQHRRQPAAGAASELGGEGAAVARHLARAAAALDAALRGAAQPTTTAASWRRWPRSTTS